MFVWSQMMSGELHQDIILKIQLYEFKINYVVYLLKKKKKQEKLASEQ